MNRSMNRSRNHRKGNGQVAHRPYIAIPLLLLLLLWSAACRQGAGASAVNVATQAPTAPLLAAAPATLTPPATVTETPPPTATPPLPTPTEMATPAATATPALTPTPDPYAGLTIADLASRSYGQGGRLEVVQELAVTESFTRTLITYPSDGLTIYGFMNEPFGAGPFPVALVLHGYIPPENYGTIGYTTRYADSLARAGYLVIHPNYRNHGPSDKTEAFLNDDEPADFRVGYAVDVLNLMAIVRAQAGAPGPLANANAAEMHLLGHSMGGGMALRIITVDDGVRAAALYGSMSGDEYKNYERILVWSDGETGEEELATAPEDMERIAPIHHLHRIQAAVAIHHGEADDVVPPEWSADLCQRLQELGKIVECFIYPGAPHTFQGEVDRLFQQRVIDFFNRH